MRKFLLTLAFLVIAVILGVVALTDKGPKEGAKGMALVTIPKDKIVEIRVHSGDRDLHLLRKPTGWVIEGSPGLRLDTEQIDSYVQEVSKLESSKEIEKEAKELAPFGLDSPSMSVKIRDSSKEETILVGKGAPTGTITYVMKENEKAVYGVESYMMERFKKGPNDFRDRKMLSFVPEQIERVEITLKGGTTLLVKVKEGEWKMESPRKGKADISLMNSLLRDLKDMTVSEFVEDSPKFLKPYGLDNPEIRILLYTKGKESVGLLLGKEKMRGSRYARNSSESGVAVVPAYFLESVKSLTAPPTKSGPLNQKTIIPSRKSPPPSKR
ncbi:MAG: DUF4340 domain-containing protein [Armatimonadetes bacterium]|nr:DUF4340 domain-containing protein [Armatimonadota bacterium]